MNNFLSSSLFHIQADEDQEDPDERHDPDSDMDVDDPKLPDEPSRYYDVPSSVLAISYMPASDMLFLLQQNSIYQYPEHKN